MHHPAPAAQATGNVPLSAEGIAEGTGAQRKNQLRIGDKFLEQLPLEQRKHTGTEFMALPLFYACSQQFWATVANYIVNIYQTEKPGAPGSKQEQFDPKLAIRPALQLWSGLIILTRSRLQKEQQATKEQMVQLPCNLLPLSCIH